MNTMENKLERISKQGLEQIYGVNRLTIESWMKNYGLPVITINSHSKYIRKSDLLDWESEMIMNNKLIGIIDEE